MVGFEPTTPDLEGRCASQLRYTRISTTSEITMCRYIGFLSFNKPVGLTLLKLVKLLGALLPAFNPQKLALWMSSLIPYLLFKC